MPGCHELLASLGFDLSDVGQDKVTLKTGKQANRRNIQFTLQALLALFDTQEAPKSLAIDSSSSLESLASVDDDFSHSDNELLSTPRSPQSKPRLAQPTFSRTVLPQKRLGGAFTSYVRRRGEPDGRTANPGDTKTLMDTKSRKNEISRNTNVESGVAAFTPSPPVMLQTETQSIALSLAHQTRIRNLYSQNDGKSDLRPDSSSSASSVTDWENGHATVLRRQAAQNHNLLPSRTKPLIDLYNNLPTGMFENSSDSELEKMEAKLFNTSGRNKIAYRKSKTAMSTLDRLSVRTELNLAQSLMIQNGNRKPITLPSEETLPTNERLLYFSPNEIENPPTKPSENDENTTDHSLTENNKTPSVTLHDTILATQLRHINRELTPTISEVYHERNIGLGLAPPLSKLLLNQTPNNHQQNDDSLLEKITLGILEESENFNAHPCPRCNSNECGCKGKVNKPWLSDGLQPQQIQNSDLTTADILEREVKNKKTLR